MLPESVLPIGINGQGKCQDTIMPYTTLTTHAVACELFL